MASFSNRLRQVILLAVLIALGFLLVKELYIFLPGFLGAVTLYILSRKNYIYLTRQKKWNKSLTATGLTGNCSKPSRNSRLSGGLVLKKG